MRLIAFQIKNYKSIKDTGLCYLSDLDHITVLAGQNESGKSSVLQALHDFETGTLRSDAERIFDESDNYPEVKCIFELEDQDSKKLLIDEVDEQSKYNEIYKDLKTALIKKKRLTLKRTFDSTDPPMSFEENDTKVADIILEKHRVNLEIQKPSEQAITALASSAASEAGPTLTSPPFPNVNLMASLVHKYTPVIVIFDDQQDLLPHSILISDLVSKNDKSQGYQAVMNLQKAFDIELIKLDTAKSLPKRLKQSEDYYKRVTADFREYWTQKIHGNNTVTLEINYREGAGEGASIEFYVLTREQERLYPAQRSRGFQWYLSFYLELKAQSRKNDQGLIILFDEPGLYLHATAQSNIKSLFEELTKSSCQIIYTTHSPYLIDVDKMNRIRLILNNEKDGTLVEKVTSHRIKGKKLDSLKPIIDAMGMEVATYLTPISKKNVIVEGISDFYYLTAFKTILDKKVDYSFLPSQGAHNSHLLMELCIGWNIEWQLLFDDDKASQTAVKKIKEQFGDKDISNKIYVIEDRQGIENLFQLTDLKRLDSKITSIPEGENSKFIEENCGGKELFARLFLDKVNSNLIDRTKLTKNCIEEFSSIFDEIEKRFK